MQINKVFMKIYELFETLSFHQNTKKNPNITLIIEKYGSKNNGK